MENTEQEIKPPKPFKSLAQIRRCDGLIAEGTVTQEAVDRDLAATDVAALPWRVGALKPDDPDQAAQDEYRAAVTARKAALAAPAGAPL